MSAHELEPDQFRKWKHAAEDRARGQDLGEIVAELVGVLENGETMTMADAKALGMAYELQERFEGEDA